MQLIYKQKHFDRFNKELISHITRIHNNLLYHKKVKSMNSSSSGTELPLVFESYGLLKDIFPLPSIQDAGYPIFNLHLANALFDVILPLVLGSSL
jgi:hypothetical protein